MARPEAPEVKEYSELAGGATMHSPTALEFYCLVSSVNP